MKGMQRVALVTGAGKGLGKAYCLMLAERGYAVVVNNRSHPGVPSFAEAVVTEIAAKGGGEFRITVTPRNWCSHSPG